MGKLHRRRLRRTQRLFSFDRTLGARLVAGCDEAGRGSLAGPLVAAAVLIDYGTLSLSDRRALGGLHDSKQMTREDRERLYPSVLRAATRVSVAVRCVRGIDGRGLHNTNLEALSSSLEQVACDGAACLVDGFRLPGCSVGHRPVVDGDATSAAIAAASVIAKVSRDRYMRGAESNYPGWGFDENVGYSTPEHRDAIAEMGISILHRRSFASVAYKQLALDGALPPELEGVADVVDAEQVAAAIEEDTDGVEADQPVGRDEGLGGEPGAGEGADSALLGGPDGEHRARRAA
ncbi:MAG: ribonuclease HII [Solirubrobacterales bacterium]